MGERVEADWLPPPEVLTLQMRELLLEGTQSRSSLLADERATRWLHSEPRQPSDWCAPATPLQPYPQAVQSLFLSRIAFCLDILPDPW